MIGAGRDGYRPGRAGRRLIGPAFAAACLLATLSGVVVLAALLGSIVAEAQGHRAALHRPPAPPWYDLWDRARDLFSFLSGLATRIGSRSPSRDGYLGGIVGTLWLLGLTALFAIPVGIGAAVFLEEYLPPGRVRRFIQMNIANLAGVPSVVYGLLGLAAFRDGFGNERLALGRTLWAGGLTLALLVLPIVVIATQEAIRTVPASLRQAALALGATRWQVVRGHVLPVALPGILTGTILALSRAIGETAPILLVGAAVTLFHVPRGPSDPYTALPVEIYDDSKNPTGGGAFRADAAGGILILMAMLLTMNAVAIALRHRFARHQRA